MTGALFQIICGSQSYDWGKLGSQSAVAQFRANIDPQFEVDESKPYAELWMGTHPSVPSVEYKTKESLKDIISKHPDYLSDSITSRFGNGQIPFLFKVLSIRKALSIQAHPDKQLAAILHANDPKHYPDANHKPEMAIAITEFEGFCGFRPLREISALLDTVPELVDLVGDKIAQDFKAEVKGHETDSEGSAGDLSNRKALQKLFGSLMTKSEPVVAVAARKLVARAKSEGSSFAGGSLAEGKQLADLIIRLNGQFPDDIGLFCGGLLLNYVKLQPGEAMFLRAKDPHAYISGDIIECMASSDNVVRAGFTPKFKDVENLVDMLTYSYSPVGEQKMVPLGFSRATAIGQAKFVLYDPPIDEFSVLEVVIEAGSKATIEGIEGPSIIIVTSGAGIIRGDNTEENINTGSVFFIAARVRVELEAVNGPFKSYRAFTEANISN